jgi:hypothetical protein
MKNYEDKQATDEGPGQRGPGDDRGPDRQGEDPSAISPRHDGRPANTGMTENLDGMFDKLRDAAAAHDDD